jgi:hypothetical protein
MRSGLALPLLVPIDSRATILDQAHRVTSQRSETVARTAVRGTT